jgi:hypothetical protein
MRLEPLDGAGREDQHAVRRLPAHGLLPGVGGDVDLGEIDRLGEDRGRGIAEGEPAALGGIQSPLGTRTPDVVPFQVKSTSRSKSTLPRSGSRRIRPRSRADPGS